MDCNFIKEILDFDSEIADDLFRKLEYLCANPDSTTQIKIENSFNEAEEKYINNYELASIYISDDSVVIDLTEESDSDNTICDSSPDLSEPATPVIEKGRFMKSAFNFSSSIGSGRSSRLKLLSKQNSMQESGYQADLDSPKKDSTQTRSNSLKVPNLAKRDYSRKSVLFSFPKLQKARAIRYFDTPPMLKKVRNEKFHWSESPDY